MTTSRLKGPLSRVSWEELWCDRPGMTDGQLLQRFASQRDAVSFETLVRRHGPMVFGVCRRVLGNRHDAEDAFQATFLVLVRKAGSLRECGVLANWLYGVAYRTALKARAAARHRRTFEEPLENVPDRATADGNDNSDLLALIDAELSRLPDRYRLAVVLCDLQGLTRAESARRLGCPEGTLSTWLLRARDLLAARLTRRGITLSAAALTLAVERSARAAVSNPLLAATIQTVTGGAIPAAAPLVGLLAERVIRSMLIAKLRIAAAIVVAAGALVCAAWLGASAPGGTAQAQDDSPAPAPAVKSEPVVRVAPKQRSQFAGAHLAALSADGTVLATATISGRTIKLWDLMRDRELGTLTLKEGDVLKLAFSPNGKMLACGGVGDIIHLWDVPRCELLTVFKEKPQPDSEILSLAFSPDSKTLATGNDLETIKLYDLATKKPTATLLFEGSDVSALAFSPDGKMLAAGGGTGTRGGLVLLWDVGERKELARLAGHKKPVKALTFTGDGKTLVTGSGDSTIGLWDLERRQLRTTLEGHTNQVTCVAVTPDSKTIISGSRDRTVRVWNTATGKEATSPLAHDGGINSLSLSADGTRFATADSTGVNGKARIWDLAPPAAAEPKVPAIPAAIQVPEGYVHLLSAEAEGVQIYVSEATKDGFKWTFRAPLADLKVMGKVDGYHYAGPTWELKGGCKVVRDDSEPIRSTESPDGKGHVPWLLIKLKADDKNTGRLAGAVYVQRINTQGGTAPSELPKRAGTEVGVKYRATYHFFSKK